MVAGRDSFTPGEGKNSWLTGTAAWTFTTISQYILGIKPTLKGLKVDPCIPSGLKSFSCDRKFRGSTYHISVDNSAGAERGIKLMTVNGEPVESLTIPVPERDGEFEVRVIMG